MSPCGIWLSKGISTATSSNSHCAGPGEGKNGARAVHHRAIERGVGGIADERGDERHAGEFAPGSSKAVLIAGPTASGKSALALELAQKTGGVIINADSMQVYRDLRIITARPTPERRRWFRTGSMAMSMPR